MLEGFFKRCLGLVLGLGVIVGLVYSLIRFSVDGLMRKGLGRFFASMWFSSFLVSGSNFVGLGGGYHRYKVDLGWNERVLGGLGLFNIVLVVSSEVVGYFRLLGWL